MWSSVVVGENHELIGRGLAMRFRRLFEVLGRPELN